MLRLIKSDMHPPPPCHLCRPHPCGPTQGPTHLHRRCLAVGAVNCFLVLVLSPRHPIHRAPVSEHAWQASTRCLIGPRELQKVSQTLRGGSAVDPYRHGPPCVQLRPAAKHIFTARLNQTAGHNASHCCGLPHTVRCYARQQRPLTRHRPPQPARRRRLLGDECRLHPDTHTLLFTICALP